MKNLESHSHFLKKETWKFSEFLFLKDGKRTQFNEIKDTLSYELASNDNLLEHVDIDCFTEHDFKDFIYKPRDLIEFAIRNKIELPDFFYSFISYKYWLQKTSWTLDEATSILYLNEKSPLPYEIINNVLEDKKLMN